MAGVKRVIAITRPPQRWTLVRGACRVGHKLLSQLEVVFGGVVSDLEETKQLYLRIISREFSTPQGG